MVRDRLGWRCPECGEKERSILRDPPADARHRGLDPDLPICICGQQVAVAHKECIALVDSDA